MHFDISQLSFRKTEEVQEKSEDDRGLYLCPSVRTKNCQWKGPLSSLFEHFRDKHEKYILAGDVFVLDFNNWLLINSCMIITGRRMNYLLKMVSHIDGCLHFYLGNMGDYTEESYTAQFTALDYNETEVNIKCATVPLTSDYKAPYNKVDFKALSKILNNPKKANFKVIFT